MTAVGIGAFDAHYAFGVVSTFNEALDCLLDVDNPVFTVSFKVLGVIFFFKGFEMVLHYLLNDILFIWFIDGQTVIPKPIALYKPGYGRTCFIYFYRLILK